MTKLEELIAKLSELFELDKADLDFGIHRIIKSKHKQIREYLETRLPARVQDELGKLASEEASSRLESLRTQVVDSFGPQAITEDGEIYESFAETPLGKEYSEVREQSEGAEASSKTENEVYSHLLEFFSRYYEDADFMSLRRRTAGRESYAIPYNGEEVVLHWANKDQYYIKSSEDLKDYTFLVDNPDAPELSGEALASGSSRSSTDSDPNGDSESDSDSDEAPQHLRVQFKLMKMDAVANNNKASRIFQLFESKNDETGELSVEIVDSDAGLVIPFHFAEGKKRSKADSEAWEQSILDRLPEKWQAMLGADDTSYTGDGSRTILQKHLRNYTKKNTSDYFIHKDLGGFLRRELDFYVKNEVMYLDDIENRPVSYVESELRKIKAIRAVAHDLIDFLAQFENFQKKLWLKKKFVVETNWLISIENIPEAFLEEISLNPKQVSQWNDDFGLSSICEDLFGVAFTDPPSVEFLKCNKHLQIDTSLFSQEFKSRLLGAYDDIDSRISGILVHSENSNALRTMQAYLKSRVDCIYIDPPYNTGNDGFTYKDQYQHSSWLSMLRERLRLLDVTKSELATFFCSIDDHESVALKQLLDAAFGVDAFEAQIIIQSNKRGHTFKSVAKTHEYLFAYSIGSAAELGELEREIDEGSRADENGPYELWELRNRNPKFGRFNRPNLFYAFYVNPNEVDSEGFASIALEESEEYCEEVFPFNSQGNESCWRWGKEKAESAIESGQRLTLVAKQKNSGEWGIYQKARKSTTKAKTIWDDNRVISERGTVEVGDLGLTDFGFPKPLGLLEKVVEVGSQEDSIVLDCFGGSGTTAHAVLNQNREKGTTRRFVLIESANYFDSVLVPRVRKASYSSDWNNGVPEHGKEGIPQFVKCIRLESYEDALNNLSLLDESPDLLGQSESVKDQYLLRYVLNVEYANSGFNFQNFASPFAFRLKTLDTANSRTVSQIVDLPETFNYLLGLRVRTMQMKEGTLVIEGENPSGETVLVIWRNVDEMDNKKLKEFVEKKLRINTADTEYAAIYINGDTTLNDPHKKILLTEQVFHDLMFDVEDV